MVYSYRSLHLAWSKGTAHEEQGEGRVTFSAYIVFLR
jgi:hypothetical protein